MDKSLYPIFFMNNVDFGLRNIFLGEKKINLQNELLTLKKKIGSFCNDNSYEYRQIVFILWE